MDGSSNQYQIKKSNNKLTVLLVILLAVMVVAIASLGFLFIKSNDDLKQARVDLEKSQQEVKDLQKEQTSADANSAVSAETTDYFEIPEWNVKFVVPEGLTSGEISYEIDGDTAKFITEKVAALGGACTIDNMPSGSLFRSTSASYSNSAVTRDDGVKAGDFYYFYTSPQSVCASDAADPNGTIEISQLGLIKETLAQPIAF